MKWSWKLGTIAGIDVFMHATFLLIIAWMGFSSWQQTGTWSGVVEGIIFTLLLFTFVVMHEYGHALTARRFGIKTRDITLYPIGGIARLERMPEKPIQEFLVALAGPAVNLGLAALLFGWLTLSGNWAPLSTISLSSGPFIERLMMVNLTLFVFNLLPAFPMDGGRVLRSLLAMRMEPTQATQTAARIGQGMAVLFAVAGFLGNPTLLFIAFFVWVGAGQEASMAQMKQTFSGVPVSRAMITNFQSLTPADTVAKAAQMAMSGLQSDFPVVYGERVIGMLTRNDILQALSQQGQMSPVTAVMHRDVPYVDADELLETAVRHFQEGNLRALPVTSGGQLVGLLTTDNIGEFLRIQSALAKAHRPGGWPPTAGRKQGKIGT